MEFKHSEKRREQWKRYRERKREKILAKKAEYRETHKNVINDYIVSPNGRAHRLVADYKIADVEANRGVGDVTPDYITNVLFPMGCYWCGEKDYTKLGCDRIDNTRPHNMDNVVCSCTRCNVRRNKKNFNEFKTLMSI